MFLASVMCLDYLRKHIDIIFSQNSVRKIFCLCERCFTSKLDLMTSIESEPSERLSDFNKSETVYVHRLAKLVHVNSFTYRSYE